MDFTGGKYNAERSGNGFPDFAAVVAKIRQRRAAFAEYNQLSYMRELRRVIDVNTSSVTVWRVLVDFDSYPEWNPLLRRVRGDLREGTRLRVRARLPGGWRLAFRPTVLAVEPGRELRWVGRLPVPWLFEGVHRFTIQELGNGRCRFSQAEQFSGLLARASSGLLEQIALGSERMNDALKLRAERSAPPPSA